MKLDAGLVCDLKDIGGFSEDMERAGFDGVYSSEGARDPFMPLVMAASRTRQVDLMIAIAVAFARNPMIVAQSAYDLQQLSGGRFILGLGSQVKTHIERRYSMPWSHPAARMREFVQALRHIWNAWETGGRLSFEGEFYNHTFSNPMFSPPPSGLPPIPVFVAGVGPLMTRVAGEVGDGVIVHPFHSSQSLTELTLRHVEEGRAIAGRTDRCQVSVQIITATAPDSDGLEQAIARARSQIAFYASTPAYKPVLEVHGWGDMQADFADMARAGRWDEMQHSVSDAMLDSFALVGTPEEVAASIRSRYTGVADRVSPITYVPDIGLHQALAQAMKKGSD